MRRTCISDISLERCTQNPSAPHHQSIPYQPSRRGGKTKNPAKPVPLQSTPQLWNKHTLLVKDFCRINPYFCSLLLKWQKYPVRVASRFAVESRRRTSLQALTQPRPSHRAQKHWTWTTAVLTLPSFSSPGTRFVGRELVAQLASVCRFSVPRIDFLFYYYSYYFSSCFAAVFVAPTLLSFTF